jgi:voltage-gated potassium channel
MIRSLQARLFHVLNITENSRKGARLLEIFILCLIVLNVLAVVAETVESIEMAYRDILWQFEVFSVIVFSVEYVARLWTCVLDQRYQRPILGRFRYALSFFALVDLLAIVPFYAPMLISFDLRFLRAVRLFRIFRLMKVARYSKALASIGNVFRSKRAELGITVIALLLFLFIASTVMYDIEHDAQPKNFPDIPSAMWWGVVTLTTVGYGDIYPITPLGKFFGSLIALLGIGLFALPAGIIASGLVEEARLSRDKKKACPHCGRELE